HTKQKDRQQEEMKYFFNEDPFSSSQEKKENPLPEASSSGEVHFKVPDKKQTLTDNDTEASVTKFVVPEIVAPTSQHDQQATVSVGPELIKKSQSSSAAETEPKAQRAAVSSKAPASMQSSAPQHAKTSLDPKHELQAANQREHADSGQALADVNRLPDT